MEIWQETRIRQVSAESKKTNHINKNIQRTPVPLLNQLGSIMLLPLILLVVAKVPGKRLLAPGAVDGVCDGREGRDGFVFSGVAEELGWSVEDQNIVKFITRYAASFGPYAIYASIQT
jgi:hypothetical protein